jgi:plastocyanin
MAVRDLRTIAAGVLLMAACACNSSKAPAPAAPPADAKRVDSSKAGSLEGRVRLDGQPPPNAPIKVAADPVCMAANTDGATTESYIVKDGGLDNVFVYVKDGLGNYYFDVPTEPVTLDQQRCRYSPHVFGIRAGQPLEITNSDQTMHNVHALPNVNQEFNIGQAMAGMKNTRTFTAPEVMVTFKCDVHSWMNAYAGVVNHPYFAVTANGGRFEMKNLPAGTYTIEAWHEKLGRQTQSVTLGEKESRTITFTFKAPAA